MDARPQLLQALLAGPTPADREAEILELLQAATPSEFDQMLADGGADRLLEEVNDHLLGPDHHQALVDLFAARGAELEPGRRAELIHALQTRSSRASAAIAELLCGLAGDELTRVKNRLNGFPDFADLENLVFHRLDETDRDRVLAHIAAHPTTPPRGREVKVVSDIDDTAFSRFNDEVFTKGQLYPGVVAFWDALDAGPNETPFDLGDLTFVTAMPMDGFGLMETRSRAALAAAGVDSLTILSGALSSLYSYRAVADHKLTNVDHVVQLFPEYDLVFLGDSGQGDVMVAEDMLTRWPGLVRGSFIHDVVDTPQAERESYAARGIHFHDTYAGAANQALAMGLISQAGWERVRQECVSGFDEAEFTSSQARSRAYAWLERDLSQEPAPR